MEPTAGTLAGGGDGASTDGVRPSDAYAAAATAAAPTPTYQKRRRRQCEVTGEVPTDSLSGSLGSLGGAGDNSAVGACRELTGLRAGTSAPLRISLASRSTAGSGAAPSSFRTSA